jgi:hypothetical protein
MIRTGAAAELSFGDRKKSWEELISETLALWDDDTFDDECPTPSIEVVKVARWAAGELQSEGTDAPLRIVPTADGGIAFEWDSYPTFDCLIVHPDCSLDLKQFEFGSLLRRRRSAGPMIAGADDDAAW